MSRSPSKTVSLRSRLCLSECSVAGELASKYGTIDNYLACHDRGIAAHLPDLKQAAVARTQNRGIFPDTRFSYDPETDTYRCPAGEALKRKSLHTNRDSLDYAAPKKACAACALRAQCTRNKMGRTIKRHLRQAALDAMRAEARSAQAKRDLATRTHLMERSFARATRFGFDRARWRGRKRVAIQEYLTASLQNIGVLMRYGGGPRRWAVTLGQAWAKAQRIGLGRGDEFFSRFRLRQFALP